MMAGIELITSEDLPDWGLVVARKFIFISIYGGSGVIEPQLWEYRSTPDKLSGIIAAFKNVIAKLNECGQIFPGRFLAEHNMLKSGEQVVDLSAVDLKEKAIALVEHLENPPQA